MKCPARTTIWAPQLISLTSWARDLDEPFFEQLRSLLVDQDVLLEVLGDDDARYCAMSRDAASSRRHVTQRNLFPGDRVSHEGQVGKLISIDMSTPSEPAKHCITMS